MKGNCLKSGRHESSDSVYDLYIVQFIKVCDYIYLYMCYVIAGKKEKRSGGDVFMMSLAIADLLASIFVPINVITDLTTNDMKWYFGALMCKILPAVSPLTLAVSSWSLVLIAADRYRLVCFHIQYKLLLKRIIRDIKALVKRIQHFI